MADSRFTRVQADPRFRRPRKQKTKVIVDERFKDIFNQGGKKKGNVDKYGRLLSSTYEEDNLKRFYRLENESNEELSKKLPDYARGEVLLQSSDEEENVGSESGEESDNADIVTVGKNHRPQLTAEDDQPEVNLDESDFADLDAQVVAYNKVHPIIPEEEGVRSRRLAIVNLDWDHVRATHIYKICSSLVSPTAPVVLDPPNVPDKTHIKHLSTKVVRGRVMSVHIYPSEFGKERLAREETEGPPIEIFKKKKDANEEVTPQSIYDIGGEDDYNEEALRRYQLERLRYYYGIITCDTIEAASHIYQELDGTELERSANIIDLSFVPEEMTFDDERKDEATAESNSMFKHVDFVTDALRHSRVKLTWDEDDPERNQVTRRKLSKKEIEAADFRAYLASGSDSEEDGIKHMGFSGGDRIKGSSRDELRALLLAGNVDDLPEGWGYESKNAGDVDMEVTFTPGLSEKKTEEGTTLDKYQKKIRDRRKKRKEDVKEKTLTADTHDDFFEVGDKDDEARSGLMAELEQPEPRKISIMRPLSTAEELALLITSEDTTERPKHFNLKSVLKAEKKTKRKPKKHEEQHEDDLQEDFSINVNDDRFKVLHEDHQYAIDPSNPQFRRTKAMTALLAERNQRQKYLSNGGPHDGPSVSLINSDQKSLRSLVENVKRKSINAVPPGERKRQKVSFR